MAQNPLDPRNSIRTFLALPLSARFGADISNIMRGIQPKIDGIKWVLPEQVHLTLHFFGSTDAEQIAVIKKTLSPITARTKPLALGIEGMGCFPDPSRPKIIWIGIAGDITNLIYLQRDIEAALAQQGFPIEAREFRPHATIGRVRTGKFVRINPHELKINIKTELQSFDRILLYQSHLLPQGPRYEPIETFLFTEK